MSLPAGTAEVRRQLRAQRRGERAGALEVQARQRVLELESLSICSITSLDTSIVFML